MWFLLRVLFLCRRLYPAAGNFNYTKCRKYSHRNAGNGQMIVKSGLLVEEFIQKYPSKQPYEDDYQRQAGHPNNRHRNGCPEFILLFSARLVHGARIISDSRLD